MDAIPPSLPFHLAKAYGVRTPSPTPSITVTPVAPGVERVEGVRPTSRPGAGDAVDLEAAKKAASIRSSLVAGTVPGGIEFGDGVAQPTGGRGASRADSRSGAPQAESVIPFYRHPADKNAAATAIDLGKRIDLEG